MARSPYPPDWESAKDRWQLSFEGGPDERLADTFYKMVQPLRAYEEDVIEQSDALISLDQYARDCIEQSSEPDAVPDRNEDPTAFQIDTIFRNMVMTRYRETLEEGLPDALLDEEQETPYPIIHTDDGLARAWDAAAQRGQSRYESGISPVNVIDHAFDTIQTHPQIDPQFKTVIRTMQHWLKEYDDHTLNGFWD